VPRSTAHPERRKAVPYDNELTGWVIVLEEYLLMNPNLDLFL
jgi:hypothetical protein